MPFNPNRINIHELTIEEPEKQSESTFDLESDITKKDWEKIMGSLEKCKKERHWEEFLRNAPRIKGLNPDANIDVGFDERQGIEKILRHEKANGLWESLPMHFMFYKMMDPNMDYYISPEEWNIMMSQLDRARANKFWDTFASLAMEAHVLNPKFDLHVDQEAWEGMRADLNKHESNGGWFNFSFLAMKMKILDPESEIDLNGRAWQGMRSEIEETKEMGKRDNNWNGFLWQAMAMKILAAQKVEFTDEGLKITTPNKKEEGFKSIIPPLPETKKF